MQQVVGYVCDFCKAAKAVKRVYASAGSCARHEKYCYRNPETRACATCQLWEDNGCDSNQCRDEHDREDIEVGNGMNYPPRPTRECVYWEPNVKITGGAPT